MLLLSRAFSQLALAAALALGLAAPARAQAPLDPTGHWEGAIDAQGNELRFELDVIRGDTGHLVGTLNVPSVGPSASMPVGISLLVDRCLSTAGRSPVSTP